MNLVPLSRGWYPKSTFMYILRVGEAMKGICVRSEINPLKKVLLHRPGREHQQGYGHRRGQSENGNSLSFHSFSSLSPLWTHPEGRYFPFNNPMCLSHLDKICFLLPYSFTPQLTSQHNNKPVYRLPQQSIRRLVLVPPYFVFCSISFRCGGLSIERNQKPLTPENTLAITHHDKQKQVEVKRSSRANPHEIRLFSGCPYYFTLPVNCHNNPLSK